jgi:sigma-B regulation protein RsbU (phosphoserine phosphatase)
MLTHIKWWIVIIVTTVFIAYWMPYNITFGINEKLNRIEAEEIAENFLSGMGYSTEGYFKTTTRIPANNLLAYLKSELPEEKYSEIISGNKIPNMRWQVRFLQNIPKDQPQTQYYVSVSPQGNIVGYQRILPDTLTIESLSEDEASRLAQLYLTDRIDASLNNYILRKSQQFRRTNRIDYTFVWEKPADFVEGDFVIRVFIQGDEEGGYEYLLHLPEAQQQIISQETTKGTFLFLVQFIGIVLIFVFSLILFLKKYHEGEVSTVLGRNLFIIAFVIGLIRSINELPVTGYSVGIGNMSAQNVQLIVFVYEVLIKNVFLGILLLTSWAVGEAYARSFWPEKMNSIDSLLNKKWFTTSTGIALLRGGAIGFTTAMVYMAINFFITGENKNIVQVAIPFGGTFQYFVPVLSMVIISVMTALVCEVVFRFFIINAVYYKWHKKWLAIGISAILWPIGYTLFSEYLLFSVIPLNLVLAFIMGLIFAWLYFKYDLLTLIAATAASNLVFQSVPLFSSDNDWHRISLLLLVLFFAIPILQIIISLIRKEKFEYSYEGLPRHIRKISERERMKKELEIARNVQMGLLPKENPHLKGFDINGFCMPAEEVGGDYFDFVTLGPNKLGIAIGDVSGKGVPAAIYMTLTKGLLQSHADDNISPRLVLNKVNKLLYRNIEKNSFVSMFYAVLDIEKKTLTFARAGHNPGIMINQKDGSTQELNTGGIALGLEEGVVFNRTLQEQTMTMSHGDTLVFYTDGFTEAMNPNREEFGEERFVKLIAENRNRPAKDLINLLVKSVKIFCKEMPQHDDMTAVVIKFA